MNTVIQMLQYIIKEADNIHMTHGRRTYAISDPLCPNAKVAAYVKTQVEKAIKPPVATATE